MADTKLAIGEILAGVREELEAERQANYTELQRRANGVAKWLALHTELSPGQCAEVGTMFLTGNIPEDSNGHQT